MKIRKINPKSSSSELINFNGEYSTPSGIVSGTTVQEWIDLHFQSINPLVSVNLSPSNGLREYGNNITNPNISANITDGANPVGSITDIKFYRGTAAGTLLQSGTETVHQDTFTVSSYQRYTIVITDSEGRTATSNKAYSFVYPFFWGVISEGDIFDNIAYSEVTTLLTKNISSKSNKNVTTSPANEKYCFMYPSGYGILKSILDKNGFETIGDYDHFEYTITDMLNGSDQTYHVYILKSNTSQTDFTNTYKF